MRGAIRLGLLAMLAATPLRAQLPPPQGPSALPAAPPSADRQRQGDARTEQALRRVLGVLMQQYGELTGKVPESLNDADIAMRAALQALQAGNDAAAAASIQNAIEALQKGGRSMSQQLAQRFGRQQDDGDDDADADGEEDGEQAGDQDGQATGPGDGPGPHHGRNRGRPGDRRADDRRDPLGRMLHEEGAGQSAAESGVRVPDEMEQARAHAIQEELRRRDAEKTRPQPELDYIERLLRQF
jgi:hypothetical protein